MYRSRNRDSENQWISWWNFEESNEILQSCFDTLGIPFEQHRITELKNIWRSGSSLVWLYFESMIFWLSCKRRFVDAWVFLYHPTAIDEPTLLEILLKSSIRSNLILLRTYLASTSFLRWSVISCFLSLWSKEWTDCIFEHSSRFTLESEDCNPILWVCEGSQDFCSSSSLFWSIPHLSPEALADEMLSLVLIPVPAQQ